MPLRRPFNSFGLWAGKYGDTITFKPNSWARATALAKVGLTFAESLKPKPPWKYYKTGGLPVDLSVPRRKDQWVEHQRV